jgi:hypothetical protein
MPDGALSRQPIACHPDAAPVVQVVHVNVVLDAGHFGDNPSAVWRNLQRAEEIAANGSGLHFALPIHPDEARA